MFFLCLEPIKQSKWWKNKLEQYVLSAYDKALKALCLAYNSTTDKKISVDHYWSVSKALLNNKHRECDYNLEHALLRVKR